MFQELPDPSAWTLFGGKGTVIGVVLILLLLLLLTGPVRRKIRWVVLFLALHLILLALRMTLPEEGTLSQGIKYLALFLLLSSIGLSLFLLLTQSRLSRTFFRPLPQIFVDIVHTQVYIVALLITLGAAGVRASELFAGSALVTAVIGLSLRDTLGNLFAGLAIQAQQPFEVGDWIQFNQDPNQAGRVAEINWRATRVVTSDEVEVVIPNGLLAQTPIINYSRPTAPTRRSITVHAPASLPPQRVKKVLQEALADTPGVLASPAPSIGTNGFDERGTQYLIRFFISSFADKSRIESAVRDHVWYALARHGIPIPVPPRSVRVHKVGRRAASRKRRARITRGEHALRGVGFFDQLPEEVLRRLARMTRHRVFADQEVILRQGQNGNELYILLSGEVIVLAENPGESPVEVARLGPGQYFGEMAALTGEPRKATVRTSRECEVVVLGKKALAYAFEASPELAEHVSQTIVRRQAELASRLAEHPTAPHLVPQQSHDLLERIKDFFSI